MSGGYGFTVTGEPVGDEAVPHGAESSQNWNGASQDRNVSRETIGSVSFSPLREALRVVEEREDDYGDPIPLYGAVGRKWAAHLSHLFGVELPDIPAKHVLLMLGDMKTTREAGRAKLDNLVDAGGYVHLAHRADK